MPMCAEYERILRKICHALRIIPVIEFYLDDSIAHASHMEELFKKLREEGELRLILLFLRRYLLVKQRTYAINIISWVAIIGLAIGAASIIVLLSSFNALRQ